jgi:uncharacterized protein (DUF697 family)
MFEQLKFKKTLDVVSSGGRHVRAVWMVGLSSSRINRQFIKLVLTRGGIPIDVSARITWQFVSLLEVFHKFNDVLKSITVATATKITKRVLSRRKRISAGMNLCETRA